MIACARAPSTRARRLPKRYHSIMKAHPIVAAAFAFALLAAVPFVRAAQTPAQGKFLVASPEMKDPNFAKTVVLLLRSDDGGTLGVIVNRPTWVEPKQVDPSLDSLPGFAGKVYRGGPVAASQIVYLMRDPATGLFKSQPVFGNVYAGADDDQIPALVKQAKPGQLRLYAGHAEWEGRQLQREIAAGQWVVVDAEAEDVFTTAPALLWDRIVHKGSEVVVDTRHRAGSAAAPGFQTRRAPAAPGAAAAAVTIPGFAAPGLSPPSLASVAAAGRDLR